MRGRRNLGRGAVGIITLIEPWACGEQPVPGASRHPPRQPDGAHRPPRLRPRPANAGAGRPEGRAGRVSPAFVVLGVSAVFGGRVGSGRGGGVHGVHGGAGGCYWGDVGDDDGGDGAQVLLLVGVGFGAVRPSQAHVQAVAVGRVQWSV